MSDFTYQVLNGIDKKLKDMGDGTHAEVVFAQAPPADESDWQDAGYVLNAAGQLTAETQKLGAATRSRSWTYSTDANGNVTATAGAWA